MINKNKGAKSCFVTYLSVKDDENINNNLIQPLVKKFFDAKKIKNYESMIENTEISDLDFKKMDFSYFYDYILNNINKKDKCVEVPIKYCVTIDEQTCLQTCDVTGIKYDEIILNKRPVFYFIYMDIKDIFSFLKGQTAK